MVFIKYWLIFIVLTLSDALPTLSPCKLGSDLLNGLVNSKNKDEDEYGIETAFGLVGDDPGNITETQDLSPQEFKDCLQHYIHSEPSINNSAPNIVPFNLHYEKLPNMGNNIAIPIPIPDDENYLPGDEGYTTYINPYNFKEKGYFNNTKNNKNNKDLDDNFIDALLNLFDDLF